MAVSTGGDWPGRRVLVLGASGFIGRWVARRLSAARADVVCAVRDPRGFAPIARTWDIRGSVEQFDARTDACERLLHDTHPEVVFNLLGYGVDRSESDASVMWELNAALPTRLARAIAPDARLVHVGSALEYGLIEGEADEAVRCEPHTPYGRAKLAGTQAVIDAAERGVSAIAVRLFTVFGPGEHPGRLFPTLVEAARQGSPVRLSGGRQRRDFALVEDIADGLLRLALTERADPVVNLATGRLTTVRDFALTAARVLGIGEDRLDFGAEAVRPDEMRLTSVSVGRLRMALGWTPEGDLNQTIPRAVQAGDGMRDES